MTKASVQQSAPDFEAISVKEGLFETVKLSECKGKWVYLLFFPMAFTFVCPTELIAFAGRQAEFEALGVQVFGVSTDSEYALLAWTNLTRDEGGLGPDFKMRLVSDKSQRISRDYGVLLEHQGVALRGLFLIDPKGVLRQATINDVGVGRSAEEALRLVKAYQFTDEHGEVCPSEWHPDTNLSTIKADPVGSRQYFAGANKRQTISNGQSESSAAKRVKASDPGA